MGDNLDATFRGEREG